MSSTVDMLRCNQSSGTGASEHGWTSYKRGCRCEICTTANRETVARQTAKRVARSIPDDIHGRPGTYDNWRCRCDRCRTAKTDQARRRRERVS